MVYMYVKTGSNVAKVNKTEFTYSIEALNDYEIVGSVNIDKTSKATDDCLSINDSKIPISHNKMNCKLIGYILVKDENDKTFCLQVVKNKSKLYALSKLQVFLLAICLLTFSLVSVSAYQLATTGKIYLPFIGVIYDSTDSVSFTGQEAPDNVGDDSEKQEYSKGQEYTGKIPTNEKKTIIDGIVYEGDYLDITSSDFLPLGNNPENEGIYLIFYVYDSSNNLIYTSPKLNPSEGVNWYPSKYLNSGVQDLVITVNVYHSDTDLQDIGTNLHVTLNIH